MYLSRALTCLTVTVLLIWQAFLLILTGYEYAGENIRTAACAGRLRQNMTNYAEAQDELQREKIIAEINARSCFGSGAMPTGTYLAVKGISKDQDWPIVIDRPGNHLSYSLIGFAGIRYMNDWSGINAGYLDGNIRFLSKKEANTLFATLYAEGATILDADGKELKPDELVLGKRRLVFNPHGATWHPLLLLVFLIIIKVAVRLRGKGSDERYSDEHQQES